MPGRPAERRRAGHHARTSRPLPRQDPRGRHRHRATRRHRRFPRRRRCPLVEPAGHRATAVLTGPPRLDQREAALDTRGLCLRSRSFSREQYRAEVNNVVIYNVKASPGPAVPRFCPADTGADELAVAVATSRRAGRSPVRDADARRFPLPTRGLQHRLGGTGQARLGPPTIPCPDPLDQLGPDTQPDRPTVVSHR